MLRLALAASLLALSVVLASCGQPAPVEAPSPAGLNTKLSQEPVDAVPLRDAPAPVAPPKPKPDLKPEAVAPEPEAPTITPPALPMVTPVGEPGSCLAEVGEARSKRLVERCIRVSPATRPPCNSANPCEMIQGEIDRSCAMYGPDEAKPRECAA